MKKKTDSRTIVSYMNKAANLANALCVLMNHDLEKLKINPMVQLNFMPLNPKNEAYLAHVGSPLSVVFFAASPEEALGLLEAKLVSLVKEKHASIQAALAAIGDRQ